MMFVNENSFFSPRCCSIVLSQTQVLLRTSASMLSHWTKAAFPHASTEVCLSHTMKPAATHPGTTCHPWACHAPSSTDISLGVHTIIKWLELGSFKVIWSNSLQWTRAPTAPSVHKPQPAQPWVSAGCSVVWDLPRAATSDSCSFICHVWNRVLASASLGEERSRTAKVMDLCHLSLM